MTRYFMRDTPLRQMEQQMMTPPHFRPRGHGLYHSGFRYKPKDVECPYCTEYDRKHPCPLNQCICLEERIEAGALDLTEFVRDCFCSEMGHSSSAVCRSILITTPSASFWAIPI